MLKLSDYQISEHTGFLPEKEIILADRSNEAWLALAERLPKILLQGNFKQIVENLPDFKVNTHRPDLWERDMRTLSYIGHAYMWGDKNVPTKLPANLATAWVATAQLLGRPPILSYPSYCLFNWQRVDTNKPPYLGNIEIIQNFLGGADEDWFILIHVDIEARAAQALRVIPQLLEDSQNQRLDAVVEGLKEVAEGLQAMNATLNRMPEYCDPYIYYTRVRPYIFGTKNNPAMPNGLIYEDCFDNQPQFYRGETGAQSGIVPTLDALLGIYHEDDPLKEYLLEMRQYMPVLHRKFVETIEQASTIKQTVRDNPNHQPLREAYVLCVNELYKFRAKHLEYAASYIHKQALQANNSNTIGTGGTPFMTYLAKHRDETVVSV
ncbi:MAG: indoleamine 2,3-dioxygenase [Microscillaceae bacterium]|nr:indoleamine 2,3-dioxygenase [Microscillaceae bacterium]MDW8461750.1 hypothetical protein [Cytophagales bacterium]